MGRSLGFFESFPFFQIGRRPRVFVGPVALTCVCVFQSDFSTPIRVSLIVVPDSSPRGFGRVKGFGQRVFRRFPLEVTGRCCTPARRTWVPAQRM